MFSLRPVTLLLVLANVGVYLLQMDMPERMAMTYALWPVGSGLVLIRAEVIAFADYVAHHGEHGFHDNPLLARVEAYAAKEGAPVVPICAALEAQIGDLSDEDKKIFLSDMGMEEPGLNRVIRRATSSWACRPTSPPVRRKCARGRSRSARRRRRPPASSTATLSAASSAPR